MLFRQIALLSIAASATHGFVNSPGNSKAAFTRSVKALADSIPSDLMSEVSLVQYRGFVEVDVF